MGDGEGTAVGIHEGSNVGIPVVGARLGTLVGSTVGVNVSLVPVML